MRAKKFVSHGIPVTQVQVETEQDMKDLNRARGRYITLETGPLTHLVDFEDVCACLVDQLRPLLEPYFGTPLCVCGMGNPDMPSDSLGPETGKRFQPHMYDIFAERSNFEKIAVVCPGTSALTNLATETIVSGVVSAMGAACVVAVDSCATKDAERLCATIQLTDSGIKNQGRTAHLCQATVGVPVIAVVVPTAISVAAPSDDGAGEEKLLLAPVQVAEAISIASFIVACALVQIAYPELDYESCKQYIDDRVYEGTGEAIMDQLRLSAFDPTEHPDAQSYLQQLRANFIRTTGLDCPLPDGSVERQAQAMIDHLAKYGALEVIHDG